LQKVAHFYLAERVVIPLLDVINWRDKSGYLDMGGTMPCLVGCRFCVNAHLAIAVKNKFETNATDTDAEKIIKDNLRRAYMVMFHGSQANESCLYKLCDVNGGDGNKFVTLRAMLKTVLLWLGFDVTMQRQQRTGQRHSICVVGSPEKILACALCVQHQQSRRMLTQVLPILLSTNNISENDKVWVREGVKMFQETCSELNINPDLNLLESVPILQAVGALVPSRTRELEEFQQLREPHEPVLGSDEENVGIVNDVGNIETQETSIQSQEYAQIDVCNVVLDDDNDDDDDISMIDHTKLTFQQQFDIVAETCAVAERNADSRMLMQLASVCAVESLSQRKRVLDDSKSRKKRKPCIFVEDSAELVQCCDYEPTDDDYSNSNSKDADDDDDNM
jgi:hypothetical protein